MCLKLEVKIVTVGELLRQTRESKGLTISNAVEKTYIQEKFIIALECNANKVVFFYDEYKTSSKLFSSVNYNSDTIHRKKIGDDNLSMDLLESWMLNNINIG